MTLHDYEGRKVIRSTIKVTKAGDGLSEALKVEPVELHHGDSVFLVMRCQVTDVQFPYSDKKNRDMLVRKHVLEAADIAIVDEPDVAELLVANADRVQRGIDSMKGQGRLDDGEDD